MKKIAVVSYAAVLGAILASAQTLAATLSTPFVFANDGQAVVCVATNTGKTPAEVTITTRDQFGGDIATSTCPLDPGASCYQGCSVNEDCACVFEGKGKVKASLQVYNSLSGNGVVMALPASK